MSSRFLRAFSKPATVEAVAHSAGQALEATECPYLVVVEIDGILKHLVGPDVSAALSLLGRLEQQGFLEAVALSVAEAGQDESPAGS